MSASASRIHDARRALGASRDRAAVKATLLRVAPWFHEDLRRRCLVGRRTELGMRVRSLPGSYAGMTVARAEELLVTLQSGDRTPRRRYTLAHELAHQLLFAVDRERVPITREHEEELCELFAQRALMPPRAVHAYLDAHGVPAEPDALFEFCKRFGVSLSAAVNCLGSHIPPEGPVALFTASCRRRPHRSETVAYRVDASACEPRMFIPRHRRLQTSGFTQLLAWVDTATPGREQVGVEQELVLRAWQRGTASWFGPASWRAFAIALPRESQLDGVGLLVFLDVSRLRAVPRDPTRMPRSGVARRATPGAEQLRLPQVA